MYACGTCTLKWSTISAISLTLSNNAEETDGVSSSHNLQNARDHIDIEALVQVQLNIVENELLDHISGVGKCTASGTGCNYSLVPGTAQEKSSSSG